MLGPRPEATTPIAVIADEGSHWTEGTYEVWHLRGEVTLEQGAQRVSGTEAIVWVTERPGTNNGPPVQQAIAYVAGDESRPVQVAFATESNTPARQVAPHWFGKLYSLRDPQWRVTNQQPPTQAKPAIYTQADAAFRAGNAELVAPALAQIPSDTPDRQPLELVQFQQQVVAPPAPAPAGASVRRVSIYSRSDVGAQADMRVLPNGESVAEVTGGVNVVVEGLQSPDIPAALGSTDKLDLEADRIIIWSPEGVGGAQFEQSGDTPLEIYLEGNIVFRQGESTVYAERMYYDVRRRVGVIIDADLLTPLPGEARQDYPGLVRLKAGVIEQLDATRFVAYDALVTTSRLEVPSFHLGSDVIAFQNTSQPIIDPLTGQQAFDATGTPQADRTKTAQSQGNKVYVGNVPIFYWPRFATDLEEPTFYVDNIRLRNDSIFGFQTLIDLDLYQVLGIQNPTPGTEWDLSLDYLSERGFAFGTTYEYATDQFGNFEGPAFGLFDAWAIDDEGRDNLGFGRRAITPEQEYRGRIFWNHRQDIENGLLSGWTAQAEVGLISDRTFLEQYYEAEWDQYKDQTTGVRLRRIRDNRSLSIEASARVNDFFTQTQSLPRLDHWMIGQDVFAETTTWNAHTSLGYLNLKTASTPSNADLLALHELFPYEQDTAGGALSARGERLLTRHELSVPLDFAPFKVVPFALGELAHWGEARDGTDLQRGYVHTGVRASIPFWAANPNVQDPVFNLNGLAHKVVFDAELSYADSNRDFTEIPLYDEIDDDAIEDIRRRLFFTPFGGTLAGGAYDPTTNPSTVDPRFDPRFYLFRTGTQGWVSSPAAEIADDLTTMRLGMRHRLQTKRGTPGRQHLVDWITFDTNLTYFPEEDRDNFGEELGLLDYDFRWHLGDRFSIVSDGAADMFDDGLRTASGGFIINRPEVGNIYVGYRTIRGPFVANVLTASFNYRFGPKWIGSATTSFDFAETGNIGQQVAISRIGESLISTLGFSVDESKNNVGLNFLVEPRFLPRLAVTKQTGVYVPPTGYYNLE